MDNDLRWKQRLAQYKKALGQLTKFIEKGNLNELELQGLIQAFEYTFELGWNLMKDYFEYQGETELKGSRDTIRLAYKRNLLLDGETWMDMIASRAKSSHTYNEETAAEIEDKILNGYFKQYKLLLVTMEALEIEQ